MTIEANNIIKKYNNLETIWNVNDRWHNYTFKMISKFIKSTIGKCINLKNIKILNAGSAGYSYDLPENNIIHIDIADKKINHLENSILASIENIPFPNETFDAIICVGSVINYCDPIVVVQEFSRVLKKKGKLILEFENSNTLELFGSNKFNRKAVLVETFYAGKETIWYFSEKFIEEIFFENGFVITLKNRWHIVSPLIYRLTKNGNFSTFFSKLDSILKFIPFFKNVSSNTIILAEKII